MLERSEKTQKMLISEAKILLGENEGTGFDG
jgi:hypothetical protein